jgi:hypothetical protein
MKRHLEKKKKCLIKDQENKLSDIELYNLSLEKNNNKKIVLNENFCTTCNKKFSNKFSYTRHIKNNKCYDNENLCTKCNKQFNNETFFLHLEDSNCYKNIIKNNKNLSFDEIKKIIITKCPQTFTRKASYIRHIQNNTCYYRHDDVEVYCSENPLAFIDTSISICNNIKCSKIASYNIENEKKGLYCKEHKLEGMINIRYKMCAYQDCIKIPVYNEENEKSGLYCKEHKKDSMIDVVSKKCIYYDCKKHPSYNKIGEKSPLYCTEHKTDDMINLVNKMCIYTGCDKMALCNKEGEKELLYCNQHKTDGMIDIKNQNKKCKTYLCNTFVSKKNDGYCLYCFVNLFPEKTVSRNYKTKEYSVVEFVKNKFQEYSWISDKTIKDGCSRRRPDLLLDLGYQVIIIEIDENQHIDYDCTCENKRIMELSQDVGHRPIVFIRFNPDDYINNDVNITSCWGQNNKGICVVKKSKEKEWAERLQTLENQINYWTDPDNKTDKTVEIIQLFYDAVKPAGCPAPHPCRETWVSPTTPSCLDFVGGLGFNLPPHPVWIL